MFMEREPFYHRADLLKLRRREKKDRLTERGPQTLTSGFIFVFVCEHDLICFSFT